MATKSYGWPWTGTQLIKYTTGETPIEAGRYYKKDMDSLN